MVPKLDSWTQSFSSLVIFSAKTSSTFSSADFWLFTGVLLKINLRALGVDFDGVLLLVSPGLASGLLPNKIALTDFLVGVAKDLDLVFWLGDSATKTPGDFLGVLENKTLLSSPLLTDSLSFGECLTILDWLFAQLGLSWNKALGNPLETHGDLDLVFMLGDSPTAFPGVPFPGVFKPFFCGVGLPISCDSKKEEFLSGDLKRADWHGGFLRMLFRFPELSRVLPAILSPSSTLVWVIDLDLINGPAEAE